MTTHILMYGLNGGATHGRVERWPCVPRIGDYVAGKKDGRRKLPLDGAYGYVTKVIWRDDGSVVLFLDGSTGLDGSPE